MSIDFMHEGREYALAFAYTCESLDAENEVWLPLSPARLSDAQSDGLKTRRTAACTLYGPDALPIGGGQARVIYDPLRQKNDSYDKAIGRKKSLTACLREFDKPLRTSAWEAYNAKTVKRASVSKRQQVSEFLAGLYLEVFFGELVKAGCQIKLGAAGADLDVTVAVPQSRPDLLEPAQKQADLFKEALHAAMADSAQVNRPTSIQPDRN